MQLQQTEGIVLQAIVFRDYDQIVTLFTPNGLIKIILKGANKKGRNNSKSCSPLTKIELSWSEGKGELGRGEEVYTTQYYAGLRQNLSTLEAGCDLLRAIQQSQLVGKASPNLYKLLLYYLDKLSVIHDPNVAVASFQLKVLKHEGLFHLPFHCMTCQEPLKEAFYHGSTTFCARHRPSSSALFSVEDVNAMDLLANCQSFSVLTQITLSPNLSKKIASFFADSLT